MQNLFNYLQDGMQWQARAVLMALQGLNDIEESWSAEYKKYMAEPTVATWNNCRERGYVISLRCGTIKSAKQLNIIFFEHRNSDAICAVKWEQLTLNPPTIETAEFGDAYKDKYDTSFEVSFGEFLKMAEWIKKQLVDFWVTNNQLETA